MSVPYQNKLLLIDDSPESIEFASHILQRSDFTIHIAKSAALALQLLKNQLPHLILLDVTMPEMNGFDFCRLLKSDPRYQHVPIIFLTASNDEKSIQKAFHLGAQDYVTKPFKPAELIARVHTQIRLLQQKEELKNAYNDLDNFCYSVAHDLKSPLLSISRLIDFLLQDCAKKFTREETDLAETIQEKAGEVTNLVDHLLELSHAGSQKIQMCEIHPDQLFLEVYEELRSLEDPLRKIQLKIDNPLPPIHGDPVLFKLLFRNILSNALKYSKKKLLTKIHISCEKTDLHFIFSVADNGAGFDMKDANRLFHVFERLHSDREFEGSGIGLAICQRILQRQNGRAWMKGQPGKGACFYFLLPHSNL